MSGKRPRPTTRTRRQFLAEAAKVAAGASVASLAGCFPDVGGEWPYLGESCTPAGQPAPVEGSAKVVEVFRDGACVKGRKPEVDAAAMRPMLLQALSALAESDAPWPALLPGVTGATRIGLKVNTLNGACATTVALTRAVVETLVEAFGVKPASIVVWDRFSADLMTLGFVPDELAGATVMGTWRSATDSSGPGYSKAFCGWVEGAAPRLSRILTELTDVTINLPVLKQHDESGVTAALKNIYGIIDNPASYHRPKLNAGMPGLYALPPIRNHLRFTVVDALKAVVEGGTAAPPNAYPQKLIVGADPLALDRYCLDLLNQMRAELFSIGPVEPETTRWLENGHALGLGAKEYRLSALTQVG